MSTYPAVDDRLPIGIFGASGRMGRALQARLAEHPRLYCAAAAGRNERADFSSCVALIDFSLPSGLNALLEQLPEGCPLVSGVTGYTPEQWALLEEHGSRAPLLWAANFSLGIAALRFLAREAARRLPDFEVELFDFHHRQKRDAPSGTALTLAEEVAKGRGEPLTQRGPLAPRTTPRELGVSVGRAGQVIGEHTLFFCGPGERLELTHRAQERGLFADGALRATEALLGRPAGRYELEQLVWEEV